MKKILFQKKLHNLLILFLITGSGWILIHLLALLGFLIFLLYIIFYFQKKLISICFYSIFLKLKHKNYCQFCQQTIEFRKIHKPKNFKSLIFNSLVLLFFISFSLLWVLGEYKLLSYFQARQLTETIKEESEIMFSNNEQRKDYLLGEIIPMPIVVSNLSKPINAIQTDLGFDPDTIEILDVSFEGSFANIFLQKEINNIRGYLRLSGGLPNPGFSGKLGLFGTIMFRTKKPGWHQIQYLPSSMVLANDGKATNLLGQSDITYYHVIEDKITEVEYQKQLQKYLNFTPISINDNFNKSYFFNDTVILGAATGLELERERNKAMEPLNELWLLIYDRWIIQHFKFL